MQFLGTPILVVDDEEGIRELFKERLQQQGYVCHTAPSGHAALEILATESIDLALVDIMMPGMTGLSLAQHLRELHRDVAVIFVTAVDSLNVAMDHIKSEGYDYMVKPVPKKRLLESVEEALRRHTTMVEEGGVASNEL